MITFCRLHINSIGCCQSIGIPRRQVLLLIFTADWYVLFLTIYYLLTYYLLFGNDLLFLGHPIAAAIARRRTKEYKWLRGYPYSLGALR